MVKDDQLIFRCFESKKNYKKDFNKGLIKRFGSKYEFYNEDINKFIFLLLRKDVYPYESLDNWERFDEMPLPDKEAFYSSLNMEDITDVQNRHAKTVLKYFNNKNLGDYHDLYVQSDILFLADYLRILCIEIYEPDPAHFLSAAGLGWKACLKKTELKLEFLTNVDVLSTVKKGIRGGMCHAIHKYAKANNKCMKNYNKNKESLYIFSI